MGNKSIEVCIPVNGKREHLLDVNFDFYFESDGIGEYEVHGHRGYDDGDEYAVLDCVNRVILTSQSGGTRLIDYDKMCAEFISAIDSAIDDALAEEENDD